LVLCIVLLVSIPLISALISIISFLLLILGLACSCLRPSGASLYYLFAVTLIF
jgi:hypothetical protein